MSTEAVSDFERRLAAVLRAHADGADLSMPADQVVAGVLSSRPARRRWLFPAAMAAVVFVAAVGLGGIYLLNQAGMAVGPATAQVNGRTYVISFTRNMEIDAADLTPFGDASSPLAWMFAGSAAFELDEVDPAIALVVRLKPGQGDDAGSYGEWVLLVRGAFTPELCAYVVTSDNPADECLLFVR